MNAQKIALLTDSCADIPQKLIKKYDIFVLPLRLLFHEGEYLDGETITPKEVYKRLPQEIPTTSLPSGDAVIRIFQKIQEKGYEKVLAVHLSAGLSGTYNLVRLVGENFVGLEVRTFDSVSGSLGEGLILLEAARMIEQGRAWGEILCAMPKLISNTKVFFCVDTLEYLQNGGRIGKITAVAGTLLQIKPIISFAPDGQLVNVAKVRGRKTAISKMIDMVAEQVPTGARYHAAVANGDCADEMQEIRAQFETRLPDALSMTEGEIDCTLATYVGPHLIGAGVQLLPDDLFD